VVIKPSVSDSFVGEYMITITHMNMDNSAKYEEDYIQIEVNSDCIEDNIHSFTKG
jgi:hypothetical protein